MLRKRDRDSLPAMIARFPRKHPSFVSRSGRSEPLEEICNLTFAFPILERNARCRTSRRRAAALLTPDWMIGRLEFTHSLLSDQDVEGGARGRRDPFVQLQAACLDQADNVGATRTPRPALSKLNPSLIHVISAHTGTFCNVSG